MCDRVTYFPVLSSSNALITVSEMGNTVCRGVFAVTVSPEQYENYGFYFRAEQTI